MGILFYIDFYESCLPPKADLLGVYVRGTFVQGAYVPFPIYEPPFYVAYTSVCSVWLVDTGLNKFFLLNETSTKTNIFDVTRACREEKRSACIKLSSSAV